MANSKYTVALSTCWLSQRHTNGYDMLCEMADLGFEYVELSHGIRITLVEGVLRGVKEGVIKVASTHNFCPLPPHVMYPAPNIYEPTSTNEHERLLWLRNTKKTLDFAVTVGAKRCIVHSGSTRFFWRNPERALNRYREDKTPEELANDAKYQKMLLRSLAKMKKASVKFMDNLAIAYSEIIPYAKERGIMLCIENREGFTELPLDFEMADFLAQFPEPRTIGYWHDAGHAQIKEQEGIISHKQLLEMNKHRHFGFHLHDVSEEGRDHQPLGTGTIDFEMLRSYFQPDQLLVLEMSPRLKTEQIVSSRDFLYKLIEED